MGGTLLASTLAYMKATNDKRIKTASFLTTLVDFADAGDLSIFVDEHFVNEMSRYMEASGGYLDGSDMAAKLFLLNYFIGIQIRLESPWLCIYSI